MPKISWIPFLALALAGCASSVPRALDDLRPGMDKDKVLNSAGNPKRTYRESAHDHWIYTYFANDKEWRREVVFEDGKVVKVTHPLAKEDWVKDLERSNSMEEYEHKARTLQQRANNFKSIDGQTEEGGEKKK